MNKRINAIVCATIIGAMATAYGTCYLRQVMVCVGYGDNLGLHNTPGCMNSATIYADETAWRWDLYSVSRGGRAGGSTESVYCDSISQSGTNPYFNPDAGSDASHFGLGFKVFYTSACNGSDFTDINGPGYSQYWQVTTSYFPSGTASTCN